MKPWRTICGITLAASVLAALVAPAAGARSIDRVIDHAGHIVDFEPLKFGGHKFIDAFKYGHAVAMRYDGREEVIDRNGAVVCVLPKDIRSGRNGALSSSVIAAERTSDHIYGIFNFKSAKFYGPANCETDFSEGLAVCRKDNNEGFINELGAFVIPPTLWNAGSFHEGLARATTTTGKHVYVDKTGKIVIKLPDNCVNKGDFSEGLAAVALRDKASSTLAKWEFIDTTGKVIIPPIFPAILPVAPEFHEGLAALCNPDELWGFIDRTGRWAIKPAFSEVNAFEHGTAKVKFGRDSFDKTKWLTHEDEYDRNWLFEEFVKKFKLIGLSRAQVIDYLGAPTRHSADVDEYDITVGRDCPEVKKVVMQYSNSGIVDKFELKAHTNKGWRQTSPGWWTKYSLPTVP